MGKSLGRENNGKGKKKREVGVFRKREKFKEKLMKVEN